MSSLVVRAMMATMRRPPPGGIIASSRVVGCGGGTPMGLPIPMMPTSSSSSSSRSSSRSSSEPPPPAIAVRTVTTPSSIASRWTGVTTYRIQSRPMLSMMSNRDPSSIGEAAATVLAPLFASFLRAPTAQPSSHFRSLSSSSSSSSGGRVDDDGNTAPDEHGGDTAPDAKKKKTAGGGRSKTTTNTQHQEWVKFQRSIAVEGFETGQVTVAYDGAAGGKRRGGKQLRRKKERERMLREHEATPDLGGGHFPALRYSPEETARLLEEAYANIPPRAGPRRTRHLKRERKRWWIKRKQDKLRKFYKLRTHQRRMEERSRRVGEVMRVKATAPEVRRRDEEYQRMVLARWVAASNLDVSAIEGMEGGGEEEVTTLEKVEKT